MPRYHNTTEKKQEIIKAFISNYDRETKPGDDMDIILEAIVVPPPPGAKNLSLPGAPFGQFDQTQRFRLHVVSNRFAGLSEAERRQALNEAIAIKRFHQSPVAMWAGTDHLALVTQVLAFTPEEAQEQNVPGYEASRPEAS